jgi:hypothetical protein
MCARPSELHPVFYGSYDWHSCVHSYWMLARLLRRFPSMAPAGDIRALFDRQLVAEKAIAAECTYLADLGERGFKRPYGWAWLLKLDTELRGLPEPRVGQRRWHRWPRSSRSASATSCRWRPIPSRRHALQHRIRAAHGRRFRGFDRRRRAAGPAAGDRVALVWRGHDCPAWGEPAATISSPLRSSRPNACGVCCHPSTFLPWFDRFLPRTSRRCEPATLFRPATVTDRSDGKIAHLDGLNLSRAWCWHALAGRPAGRGCTSRC